MCSCISLGTPFGVIGKKDHLRITELMHESALPWREVLGLFEISVLYADEAIVCVHKPAGVPTVDDGFNNMLMITEQASNQGRAERERRSERLRLVGRLGGGVSGVLLLARSNFNAKHWSAELTSGALIGKYVARVHGLLDIGAACMGRGVTQRQSVGNHLLLDLSAPLT